MASCSQPPADDCGRRPPRRSAPAIAKPLRRILAFEPRLALSANPGADLLLDALSALHSDDFNANDFNANAIANFCQPFDSQAGDVQGTDPQLLSSSSASSFAELPPLLEQAAAVRGSYGLSGAGQTVAVIDSGIAWDHVALGGGFGPGYRVVGGWDFAEGDADPYDDAPAGFHGTHVAGLIGGQSDSLSGIAPGADLVALRVFDDAGVGSLDWIESALQWVYDNRDTFASPITTVNISIGTLLPDALAADVQIQLEDELAQLREASILVVAAAGNAYDSAFPDRLTYPASSPHTWAVGSVDADGSLSSFSQRSDAMLTTVGRGVTSSVPDHVLGWDGEVNDYHAANGTSMAAPQIAAASVLLREAFAETGHDATLDEMLERLQQTADERVDPATGTRYYEVNLAAAIDSVLGSTGTPGPTTPESPAPGPADPGDSTPPQTPPLDPAQLDTDPIDLGHVEWSRVELGGATTIHATTIHATAVRSGLFSVAFETEADRGAVRIEDASGNVLWNGDAPATGQIDVRVVADQKLSISIASPLNSSPDGSAAVRLANVVGVHEGRLQLSSVAGDPEIGLDVSDGVVARIGNLEYAFAAGEVTSGVIDGGSGADALRITSSAAAARLVLNPYADGTLTAGDRSFVLRGFEDVRYEGSGGSDRAYLYDTRGNDRLEARPGQAMLEGAGFRYEVSNVQRVYVHATAGGADMAFLHDSPEDDQLAVRPQFVSLRGGEFFNSAYGFERVYAYATAGGHDVANLYDSAGDDRMTASAESAWISGQGYYAQARSFDSVTGHATAGGHDRATLYADDHGAGRWHQSPGLTELRNDAGQSRAARGFEQTESYSAGVAVQFLGGLTKSDAASELTPEAEEPEAWRVRELLHLAGPLVGSMASLPNSPAAILPPPLGNPEAERELLKDLFAEFGEEE
ncbi:S8 family peptidase [Candidatus Laterigemmans baculatus]|uniref:S8 family peptidase n=1 Tax=Candidatus Laterigemmans baculatus TaxID=2770505 RepID=UPI0013DA98B7|nr:S8 family serine peptidase [Candidatus Laterigemmans baculatus]